MCFYLASNYDYKNNSAGRGGALFTAELLLLQEEQAAVAAAADCVLGAHARIGAV